MREEILTRLSRHPLPIAPRRLATSQYSGEWPSPYTGKGMDFRRHRAYQLGDDLRSVHMATTVRTGTRMVIERVARRDLSILVVMDVTPSMGVRRKADIMLAAGLMLLYSGVTLEMRTGAAVYDGTGYRRIGMGMGQRHAMRIFTTLEAVCLALRAGQRPVLDFPRAEIKRLLPAGGILLFVSDFLDERGYPLPWSAYAVAASSYDFIPVVVQDEFECSFPEPGGDTLLELVNPETGLRNHVWTGQAERRQLRGLHEQRFAALSAGFAGRGIGFVHVRMPSLDHVHGNLARFFDLR